MKEMLGLNEIDELKAKKEDNGKETNYAYSVFQQPWWLDAVAPGHWGEVAVIKGSEVFARMPYVVKKKCGFTLLTMPPLTQTLGPWLRPSHAKYANQLGEQKDLLEELIKKLPPFDYFSQNFSPAVTNWLPFYWAGFKQTTRYTYRIEDLSDLDKVWAGFRENIRSDIRKAQKLVAVRDDLGIEQFIQINRLTFTRQGRSLPYAAELVKRIDKACSERNARRIFFAQDADGRVHAAVYMVWDVNAAYYLMGGGDPELRRSGATSLLLWEAIKFASQVSRCFDFEGSMLEPIERFFRAFGGKQVPYFHLTKCSRRMQVILSGRDLLRALLGR